MPIFEGWFSIYLMLNCVISHQKDCFCALKGLQVNLAPLHCLICKNMYVWIYDWCKSVALKPRFDGRPKILMKMQGWYNNPKWEILTFMWPHSLGRSKNVTVLPNSIFYISHNKFQGYIPKKSLGKDFKIFYANLALPLGAWSF